MNATEPCDSEDLAIFRSSIANVLATQSGSLAVHAFVDGKVDLAANLREQAAELGWLAIGLPEDHGGFGFGLRGAHLLHEELGQVVAPGNYIATLAAAHVLATSGDEAVQNAWLQPIVAGRIDPAISAQPAAACSVAHDASGVTGQLLLLGDKDAPVALIPLSTGEIGLVDIAECSKQRLDAWDRTRSIFSADLEKAPLLATIAASEQPQRALVRCALISVAADSVGTGNGILAKTIAYMKEREQFGRPIGSFQALKHRVVDMVARIDIAKHVLDNAVDAAEAGDPAAHMWAALAKVSATQAAVFVASDCVQLFGGVGFTWEYDAHLYLKRARMNEMLIGSNAQLSDAAAEDLARLTKAGRSVLELASI
jgi:alkylation response protein AidB-like acyl-CoA dehydrogenase